MAEPSSNSIARLFTDLIGRNVSFSEQPQRIMANGRQLYCVYLIRPMDSMRVIQADLSLLSSFAGALMGMSSETVKERVAEPKLDEALKDALNEVMNIASRVVSSENRAVFKGMYADSGSMPIDARSTLRDPCYSTHFSVKIDGYEGGSLSLLAPF
jgi:hypothetical protein